jgi:peptide/nickel transport system permease protein
MLTPRFVLIRLAQSGLLFAVVTLLVFALLQAIPGGPLRAILGEAAGTDPRAIQRAEELLGFSKPLHERYLGWLAGLTRGDLGESWTVAAGRPVGPILRGALRNTLSLTISALAIALVVGGLLGVASALVKDSRLDHALGLAAYVMGGAPTFWLGMLLIIAFAVELRLLPASGAQTIGQGDFADRTRHLILPVLTLVLVQVAPWSRVFRAAVLEELRREYVQTARAKGLSLRTILGRHVAPNAMAPIVTLIALDVPVLIAGATVTEAVFSFPGVGLLLVTALKAHDWPIVQGIALVLGVAVILANLAADILIGAINPRLRAG